MDGIKKIDKLIINSPYEEPREYWSYERNTRTFNKTEGRRPAGYVIATPHSKAFDDPGVFVEIPLVNDIRKRIKKWRENNYPGVTGITKRLLDKWSKNVGLDIIQQIKDYSKECSALESSAPTPYEFKK